MHSNDLWNAETAAGYDTPGEGAFADAVLEPAVNTLVALAEGGRVLEFAVGTGRVAVPLLARGVEVSGIELSPDMVAQLRTKATETELPVVLGDMSSARAPGEFTLVYLVFNTIGNLLTQRAQVDCFRNAAAHLRPGGRFLIELMVPELRQLPPGKQATVFTVESGYIGVDTYETVDQQLVSYHFRFGEGTDAKVFHMPQRYIWPAELDLMAQLAGFEREYRHADFAQSPFTAESTSHVTVYRLPDSAG
ncbi:MAG TPA: class I SAM-dependent methyltransferase [Micropruina sp.]|nr:class I SAM-dependent methyltransferase [Micropruina sp.]